jgi:outer membrane receptor protein involved in Fe transport
MLRGGLFGNVGGQTAAPPPDSGAAAPSPAQIQEVQSTPANIIGGAEAVSRGTTDVGDLLGKSLSSVGVQVQRRNPIVSEPRIRGYYGGQITTVADGAYWFPARPDLDTIVSKLDSTLINNIVVIKGPYSVRHGYGFSFLDVETLPTPRYDHGWETHGASSIGYKTNGAGWHGRQAVWGGDADWGFRAGWDVLAGNDYYDGDHNRLPSSYNSQNFDLSLGAHLTPELTLEFKYFRLHQRNVEFPGVVTDINRLVTDALALRMAWDDPTAYERMTFDVWFNETRFNGDNLRPGKRAQIPLLNNIGNGLQLNIDTNGDANSWGGRHAMTWGAIDAAQLTVGWDFRYISQAINELDTFFLPGAQGGLTTNFPVPRSWQTDPGLFIDAALPVGEQFVFKAGSRVDFVTARIQQPLTFPDPSGQADLLKPEELGPNAFDEQHFDLISAFTTGEYKVTEEVSLLAGYGFAQRAPTLVELYADGTFLGLLQNGFTFVKGRPTLSEEQLHQIDLGMRANYEKYRGGVSGFCSWINDYITYQLEFNPKDDTENKLPEFAGYRYKNTGLATLIGVEFYSEYDLLDWLTPFGVVSYVEGRDHEIEEPLPGIYPLDSRVGLRVHDPVRSPRWAVEFTTRMVASQDRFAESLLEERTGGFTIFDVRSYWLVRDNVLLTAGVENIGDRFYREHLDLRSGVRGGVFQPGVNIYMGMRVTY